MPIYLSKSQYCCAIQCPKMLWLKKHCPEEFDDSVLRQSVLDTGNEVGDLAMGLFGDYTEVTVLKEDGSPDIPAMLQKTQECLKVGVENICEASFSYDGMYCAVDILKNLGNNRVEIYEVKSSTAIKDIYYDDVAYQTYVLTRLGYQVEKVCIVHVNNGYVRQGDLELDKLLDKLFVINDVTSHALDRQEDVASYTRFLKEYLQRTDEPRRELDSYCFKPYDCGFWKHCTAHLPSPNVFDLSGVQAKTKLKLYRQGFHSFEDLVYCQTLNTKPMVQVLHEVNDCPAQIDREAVGSFLDTLSYPLYFLDFETFNPAIPLYDGTKPYEQVPFQYSLHYIEKPNGELKHKEYLAQPDSDSRRELAEQLCRDIPRNTCTVAYNMSFEKGVISRLAAEFPDLAGHLMNIYGNIKDLMVPFQRQEYYTRAMQGSYSIKYVLPALFPNDPTLDYHNLEGIHNGSEASAAFMEMGKLSAEETVALRKNLLKYCELDTYAMVKVWEKLRKTVNER